MKDLTPTIVNKLFQCIVVHNTEKNYAHKSVKVVIYFIALGLGSLSDEQKIRNMTK